MNITQPYGFYHSDGERQLPLSEHTGIEESSSDNENFDIEHDLKRIAKEKVDSLFFRELPPQMAPTQAEINQLSALDLRILRTKNRTRYREIFEAQLKEDRRAKKIQLSKNLDAASSSAIKAETEALANKIEQLALGQIKMQKHIDAIEGMLTEMKGILHVIVQTK